MFLQRLHVPAQLVLLNLFSLKNNSATALFSPPGAGTPSIFRWRFRLIGASLPSAPAPVFRAASSERFEDGYAAFERRRRYAHLFQKKHRAIRSRELLVRRFGQRSVFVASVFPCSLASTMAQVRRKSRKSRYAWRRSLQVRSRAFDALAFFFGARFLSVRISANALAARSPFF